MTIGERIKNLRNKLNMSQVDFADKINVSKQTLYKYENNIITNIPSDKIEAIAKIGNVSPAYLMGWTEDDSLYAPKIFNAFDHMITKNSPHVMLILSGLCKTRRIEKNYTEKQVADKSFVGLTEYIQFEEGQNIGLLKIKQILRVLDIKVKYAEYILDQYCTSYDILTDLNVPLSDLENIAKRVAKFNISTIEDEYERKTHENVAQYLNAASKRTDIKVTEGTDTSDDDIMDAEDF